MGGAATRSAAPPAFRLDIVRSLRQHGALALSVGTVVFALVVMFALSRKPMYKAESMTYVEPLVTRSVDDGTPGVYDPSRYDSYLQQQMQTATRPDILEQAIATLPKGTWQMPGEDIHSAAARLAASLKVQRVAQSYQLSISLTGPNPRQAADVVNAATTTFLQQGRHDETVRQDGRLQLLKEEHARIQAQLDADQKEQTQLGQQLGVADPAGSLGNPYDSQLASIRAELVSARQAHDIAAAQLASIASKKDPEGANAVADDAIASDASVTALKQTITQRRAMLANQMAGLTPANPVYKQDQQEITQLDKQLDGRVTQLRDVAERKLEDKLRLDLARTGDVESRLNSQLAQQTSLAHTAAPRLQRATELAADITRLENRYTAVEDAIRGLSLDTNGPGTAHLVVAASVPARPEPSKQFLLFVMALPLGILAGICAAILARKRDPHLYTEGDVEEQIGFLPMVVMPAIEEVSSVAAEEYLLRMAAALERAYRVGHARTFVFTAATASTDISGFVHALRLKLIGLGFKTQAMAAEEALLGHGAGSLPAAVGPGLQDGLASASLDRLKSSYDMILLEARPLMHSAEAEYAVRTADATILIVESSVTTNAEIRDCALLLQRVKADGVGVVLLGLHRNMVGAEMRASIAEAERRRPMRITPPESRQPRVLEDRVYDMMERRARQETLISARDEDGKLGIVEPKRAPDEDQAPYEDRIPSFQNEEQDGTPYVECVTAVRPGVTPSAFSRSVSSASTREIPMRDETDALRKSLAQVEFNDNNLADDLPDGSAAMGRSFFRFFERQPEEELPAVVGSEIERAFDRVLKRPEPQRQAARTDSARGGAESMAQLPQRYIPADPIPSVVPEPAPRMQELVAAEPMQPAWSFVPESETRQPEFSRLPELPQRNAAWGQAEFAPLSDPAYSPAPTHSTLHPEDRSAYTAPATPEWPSLPPVESIYVPPVLAPVPVASVPAAHASGDYAQTDYAETAYVPTEPVWPGSSVTERNSFPDPEVRPFAREQYRTAAPAVPMAQPLVQQPAPDPSRDSGKFRQVAASSATLDRLRSELLPGHALASDPAGSIYVLRDEATTPAASQAGVPEAMTISSARSAAAAAAQRLAARMAAELPAVPEVAPFQRREAVMPRATAVAAEPVEQIAAPEVPLAVPASASALPVPAPAATVAGSENEMPGWLSSAEADRIRQLLARFSDGVARSQTEEPVASWFAQPRTAGSSEATASVADAGAALPPVSSVATPQPSSSEIHFGVPSFEAPAVVIPQVVAEVHQPVAAFAPPAQEAQLAHETQEEEHEAAPQLQWPSWPALSRNATLLPSDHEEAKSRPWYETFEENFRESEARDVKLAQSQVAAPDVAEPTAVEPAPSIWAHHVEAEPIASAFAPHVDLPEARILTASAPLPPATAYAESAATAAALPVVAVPAWPDVPANTASAWHAEPAHVEMPAEPMSAPIVIQVPEQAAQPIIEAVNNSPSHAVLPTNPISTLYSSHTASAVSRASAEAVLARTLSQTPVRTFEESGPLYFHESHAAAPMVHEDAGQMLHFNGNGPGHEPAISNLPPISNLPSSSNGNGTSSNGNGHLSNGYHRLAESTPYESLARETEFEAPIPWKTRKPPVSAAPQTTAPIHELTPQPGRWGMLSRFDPQSASADVLGPLSARRDDPEEESQRKMAAR